MQDLTEPILELIRMAATDLPPDVEAALRRSIENEQPGSAARGALETILKNVETSQWAMALKGSSDDLKQKILGNMSARAADLLREEMEYLGAVRMSSVEQTQQQIVDIVRRLEDAGELTLHAGEEEEQFIQ